MSDPSGDLSGDLSGDPVNDPVNADAFLDARVRRGLQSLPAPDDVRTTAALAAVRAEHREPARPPWALVAAAAAVVVVLLVSLPLLLRSELLGDEPDPAPAPASTLSGSWTRDVTSTQDRSWVGTWSIGFADRGVLMLSPPTRAREVGDGAAYTTDGPQVRMDAFVNSLCDGLPPGVYGWAQTGGGLRLTVLDDACEARAEVFEGTWRQVQ